MQKGRKIVKQKIKIVMKKSKIKKNKKETAFVSRLKS
jgi:hypothetical protein